MPEAAKKFDDLTCVVFGCGPVGLMGILSALEKFKTVWAVDGVPERLAQAKKYGAIPINLSEDVAKVIKEATNGRGCDAAL